MTREFSGRNNTFMRDQIKNDKLIYLLQRGLPLVSHPFEEIARLLELSENEVIDEIKKFQRVGLVRRFGGVFNSSGLGFQTCLCAVNIPESDLERVNSLISPNPGVTHCYLRDEVPNLWFTITIHKTQYNEAMEKLRHLLLPDRLLTFPAVKAFKIQVIFDKTDSGQPVPVSALPGETVKLSDREKQVVRRLQGDVPISTTPFSHIAETVACSEKELLQLLQKWQHSGVLKRISCIIRHQRFGFKGNAMCVWNLPEEQLEETGAKLAEHSFVTHCYQREINADFPFNLYAMVHAENKEKVKEKFKELEKLENLKNGRMLFSAKELKKTSPVYF